MSRLKEALHKMWKREEEEQWTYGKLGRLNQDGTYTFDVPGRDTFLYVTVRTASGGQTIVAARNDAGVPHAPRLNVKMKLEQGIYVIYGKTGRQDLGLNPPVPETGVEVHNHDDRYFRENEHLNVSAGVADAGKPVVLDAAGQLDDSFIPTVGIINSATEQTVLEDTNNFVLTDGTDLKRATWATIWGTILTMAAVLFAPISKGVTNGDSHDHNGGDGAQINHTTLSNIGTNTHAQIDTAIATAVANDATAAAHIAATTAHGATGAVMGTTNAQVVQNKTLDSSNISGLTDKNPPIDADSVVIVDSAASNVFKRTTWANIKAALTTVFNGLYVALTGNQTIAGVKTFTDHIVAQVIRQANETGGLTLLAGTSSTQGPFINMIGKDNGGSTDGNVEIVSTTESSAVGNIEFYIYDGSAFTRVGRIYGSDGDLEILGTLKAMSAAGLRLEDDGGTLAIFVEDGGNVGIGTNDPATTLQVNGTIRMLAAGGGRYEFFRDDTTVNATNLIGAFVFLSNDASLASNPTEVAQILVRAAGTYASGDVPTAIEFWQMLDGTEVLAQTAKIDENGVLNANFGVTVTQPTLGGEVLRLQSTATNDDPTESVVQNRAATTDATETTLHTFTIASGSAVYMDIRVVARRTGGSAGASGDMATYHARAAVKNPSGTAALLGGGASILAFEDQAGWNCTVDVTGGTARVRVTGAANNNITWHMTAKIYTVSS